jgi:hypothetical protein
MFKPTERTQALRDLVESLANLASFIEQQKWGGLGGARIVAIKHLRVTTHLSLKEAKDLVDVICPNDWDVLKREAQRCVISTAGVQAHTWDTRGRATGYEIGSDWVEETSEAKNLIAYMATEQLKEIPSVRPGEIGHSHRPVFARKTGSTAPVEQLLVRDAQGCVFALGCSWEEE